MVTKLTSFTKKIISELFYDIMFYSIRLGFLRFMCTIFSKFPEKKFSNYFLKKKDQYILNYLNHNYGHIFKKYSDYNFSEKEMCVHNSKILPIWVCWLDGVDEAPPLVKQCIKSIENAAGKHPVHVITWENFSQYVLIPKYILEKVNNGIIQKAHFADVLRIFLLEQYGGLWLDSTIYCNGLLPDYYFNSYFFTCKSPKQEIGCISMNRWTTFCIGGKQNNVFFKAMKDFFTEYWRYEKHAIDYLFFDAAIELSRTLVPSIDVMIDSVPFNNLQRDSLITRFPNEWSPGCIDDLLDSNNVLFKLGYRENFYLKEYTSSNQLTVYGAFLKNFYREG